MTYFSALLLGFIQGVAEFLPISSSGHLSIFQNFFGLADVEQDHMLFDVLLHLGTLAAVIAAYWPEIKGLVITFFHMFRRDPAAAKAERQSRRLILLLIAASLPLVLVLPVKSRVEALYSNTFFIGFALIATGLVLFAADRVRRGAKNVKSMTLADALIVGAAQAVAVVPGLSRSGVTIAAGMCRRMDREFAVQFSLLLSIPAVVGANLLTLIDAIGAGVDWSLLPKYLLGVVAAAGFGYLSIRLLKLIAKKGSFGGFSYYCWGAGLVTLALSLIG